MQLTSESHFRAESDFRRYEALLEIADVMVRHDNLPELFREIAQRLHKVAEFEFITFSVHDPVHSVMRLHIWEGAESPPVPVEAPVDDSVSGWVWQSQQALIIPDVRKESRFQNTLRVLGELGVCSYCMLPLTTAQQRIGALGLGSGQVGAYDATDLQLLLRVAQLAALAVENVLTRQALTEEKKRLQTLLEVHRALVSSLDFAKLLPAISESLRRVTQVDYASVTLPDEGGESMRTYAPDSLMSGVELEASLLSSDSLAACVLREREMKVFRRSDSNAERFSMVRRWFEQGVQSGCCIPLITSKGAIGTLNLASTAEHAFDPEHLNLLQQIAGQMAIAIENASAYQEIAELKDKLAEEKLYLEHEILAELNCEEIVGESPALKRVLAQAKTVAPSGATVLILGETGTGKELIARAIHRMSLRKENNFIKINCAAIPTGLLESELFGHEKGAFTGAISQRIGHLELAHKGTLFLDEIGDIPLELQPKLLRVLQDQEFERLGSTRTIRVNVRVIAATNHDLGKSVAERNFRSDLFYRLNVFPIRLPSLRERRKDIPLLVRYFVQNFARRMDKHIETIPAETMDALMSWDWPGNVRELENFIERSVILSEGLVLRVPLAELRPPYESRGAAETTLEKVQREHIIRVLRETSGVVAGLHGAAARLGMKRTTLQSKMQRLGITRKDYES